MNFYSLYIPDISVFSEGFASDCPSLALSKKMKSDRYLKPESFFMLETKYGI